MGQEKDMYVVMRSMTPHFSKKQIQSEKQSSSPKVTSPIQSEDVYATNESLAELGFAVTFISLEFEKQLLQGKNVLVEDLIFRSCVSKATGQVSDTYEN